MIFSHSLVFWFWVLEGLGFDKLVFGEKVHFIKVNFIWCYFGNNLALFALLLS